MSVWLTAELKQEVRQTFEPKYKRLLTEDEVVEIANNLVGLVEVYAKSKYEQSRG